MRAFPYPRALALAFTMRMAPDACIHPRLPSCSPPLSTSISAASAVALYPLSSLPLPLHGPHPQACGVICVAESGGAAEVTDADGHEVLFPDRLFTVSGGVVCASRWATPEQKAKLLAAAARTAT